jgi:hypothetical protein
MRAWCIQSPSEAHLNGEKQLSCVDNQLELVMDEEVLIVAIVFSSVALVFGLFTYFRFRGRAEKQQTIRLALEKGTELSPEFIKQLGEAEPSKDKDLRRGLIWLALGLAMVILGIGVNEPNAIGPMMGSAAFPALIGVAYLVMWRYGARKV